MSSSSNNPDDEHFRRMYSKAIAEALRAKEEEEQKQIDKNAKQDESKSWERALSAYSELCHDDPIISGGDGDCRYLAQSLTPTHDGRYENKLGLCSRLVDGLLQVVARAESKSSAHITQTQDSDAQSNSDSPMGTTGMASREGYAQLAFAMFVEGPYRCIQQADNLSVSSSFLGSFEPPKTTLKSHELSNEERSRLVDEATASIVEGIEKMALEEENRKTDQKASNNKNDDACSSSSSSDFFHRNNNNQSSTHNEDDSMEEIFAEESDPDDYDFGDGFFNKQNDIGPEAASVDDDNVTSGFDPLSLSKPNTINQTWEGAQKALFYLMSNLSYGKLLFSSLSTRTWLDMSVSDTLADFAFMLLLHHANCSDEGATNKKSLLMSASDKHDGDDCLDISALWDRPLFLLRDRALDSNRDHDALVSYLQLLQAFLSHSENDIMSILSSSSSKQSSLLPPITSVGLSGLATLCSSKELTSISASKMSSSSVLSICPREEVKKTILSSLYSLAYVLECVRPRKLANNEEMIENERLWIRTAACIFPIIEYLTNLRARFDFQTIFEGSGGKNFALNDADAKCILDSGLLRELLALCAASGKYFSTSTDDKNMSETCNVMREQLLRTIYALCVSSPEIVGKYAVRVPDLAKEVQSAEFMEEHLLDGILWNALSSSILESKSDAPAPRLKLRVNTKSKSAGPEGEKNMGQRCSAGFLKMCSSAQLALSVLKEAATISTVDDTNMNKKEELEKHKKSLADIICFANCLANCSNATSIWISSLNNEKDGATKVKEKVTELRSALANIPSYTDTTIAQCTGHKKNDDDENTEQEPPEENVMKQKEASSVQKQKEFGKMVASVRSSIKIISSALESQKGCGLSLKGGVLGNISSKTD